MMKILIWGTGDVGNGYMQYLHPLVECYVEIIAFIDNKITSDSFYKYPVISPDKIKEFNPDKIVIMTYLYQNEIINQIKEEALADINRVITSHQYYSEILAFLKRDKKRICFVGDNNTYQRAQFRADLMLYQNDYVKKPQSLTREYDCYFLAPPPLEKREAEIIKIEHNIEMQLKWMGVEDNKIWGSFAWMRLLFSDISMSFGDGNPDKDIYLIATSEPLVGWANLIWLVLTGVKYAKTHGMIPVVDMKYAINQYLEGGKTGCYNAWEQYFLPVSDITLEEAYKSKHVVICGGQPNLEIEGDPSDIALRKDVKNSIYEWKDKNFPKEKILGVVYRGTDYNNGILGHPAPYDINRFIDLVKKQLSIIGYRYVFLATEVEEAISAFDKAFKGYIIYTDQARYHANERRWLAQISFQRDNDAYLRGLEYLTVLYLLSECDSLMSQRNGALIISKILNGGKYEHIIEL